MMTNPEELQAGDGATAGNATSTRC
jgi:hypothetical protein